MTFTLWHVTLWHLALIIIFARIRQKHIGAYQSDRPMLGSIASGIRKPFRGPPIDRATGLPWRRG